MRTMRPTLMATLVSMLLLAGCSPSGDAPPSSVCPSCRPQVGGQTSDFSGDLPRCDWDDDAPNGAAAAHFELEQIAEQLSSEVELPLLWGAAIDDKRPPASAATSATEVTLSFELGSFRHRKSEMCEEHVSAPVLIAFATADGRISGVAEGKLIRAVDERAWRIYANADLSEVEGTLDPVVDTTRIHEGLADLRIHGSELGIRGVLRAGLNYYENEEDYALAHRVTDTPPPVERDELAYGWFPEDGCGDDAFAVPSAEPHAWLDDRSPADIVAQTNMQMTAAGPASARWRDGTETTITIELDAPGDQSCMSSDDGSVRTTLHSFARIRSDDGHVDVAAPGVQILSFDGDANAHEISFFKRLESGTPSELAELGLRDLDLGSHATVSATIRAWHFLGDTVQPPRGSIELFDGTTSEELDSVEWEQ